MKPSPPSTCSTARKPNLSLEADIQKRTGLEFIAGLDEAGRGAIAGPVVAAAVILPLDSPDISRLLSQVNDSKQLSPIQRETQYRLIVAHALSFGVGSSSAEEIDEIGIIPANAKAMRTAISQLDPSPQYLLLDGRMRLRNEPLPQESVIRGDQLSLSIAAASVLAKVSRDKHMLELDERFPQYGFARNKGYCTPEHVSALEQHGPCELHRHSFAPIRKSLL